MGFTLKGTQLKSDRQDSDSKNAHHYRGKITQRSKISMKAAILLAICLGWALSLWCAVISGFVYAVDRKPNLQTDLLIPIEPDSLVSITQLIDLEQIPDGFHNVYFQVRDDSGAFSLCNTIPCYKQPTDFETSTISRVEWFVDDDPGAGFGIYQVFPPATDITTSFNSLYYDAPGFHNLYVRVRNSKGAWSFKQHMPVYLQDSNSQGPSWIEQFEVFADNDPGPGMGQPFWAFGQDLQLTLSPDLAGLEPGTHTLYIRCKSETGAWSHKTPLSIYKLETEAARYVAGFKWFFTGVGADPQEKYYWYAPQAVNQLEASLVLSISQLPDDRDYVLHIGAIDIAGRESHHQQFGFNKNTIADITAFGMVENALQISWQSVPWANGYRVYASANPTGDWQALNPQLLSENTWTIPLTELRQFYYVTAVKNTRDTDGQVTAAKQYEPRPPFQPSPRESSK